LRDLSTAEPMRLTAAAGRVFALVVAQAERTALGLSEDHLARSSHPRLSA
jgi:hypothetical protein